MEYIAFALQLGPHIYICRAICSAQKQEMKFSGTFITWKRRWLQCFLHTKSPCLEEYAHLEQDLLFCVKAAELYVLSWVNSLAEKHKPRRRQSL